MSDRIRAAPRAVNGSGGATALGGRRGRRGLVAHGVEMVVDAAPRHQLVMGPHLGDGPWSMTTMRSAFRIVDSRWAMTTEVRPRRGLRSAL